MNFKRHMHREAHKKHTPFHCGRPMIEKMGHGIPRMRVFICPKCRKIKWLPTGEDDTKQKNEKEPANDNT